MRTKQVILSSKHCLAVAILLAGCNGILDNPEGQLDSDAGPDTQGGTSMGGHSNTGGATAKAGTSNQAGATNAGGSTSNGGTNAAAGASAIGGIAAVGGATANGGASAFGGTLATGGLANIGGASGTGRTSAKGGSIATGGIGTTAGNAGLGGVSSGGTSATGGTGTRLTSTGGNSASGGAMATGGIAATGGVPPCTPDDGRCSGTTPQKCNASGQWTNQPACTPAAPTCSNGGCICTAHLCSGNCVDFATDVANCGTCGHECSVAGATTARSCSGGLCAPACQAGYFNCSTPLSPNTDDGCECAGSACCGTGCQTKHNSNGWEIYYSCSPGIDGTSAMDACNQYKKTHATTSICSPTTGGAVSLGCEYGWFYVTSTSTTGPKAGEIWKMGCSPVSLFGAWN